MFWLDVGVLIVAVYFVNSLLISSAMVATAAAAGFWYWYHYVPLVPYGAVAAEG
jgi:hypothetical protein